MDQNLEIISDIGDKILVVNLAQRKSQKSVMGNLDLSMAQIKSPRGKIIHFNQEMKRRETRETKGSFYRRQRDENLVLL